MIFKNKNFSNPIKTNIIEKLQTKPILYSTQKSVHKQF